MCFIIIGKTNVSEQHVICILFVTQTMLLFMACCVRAVEQRVVAIRISSLAPPSRATAWRHLSRGRKWQAVSVTASVCAIYFTDLFFISKSALDVC